MLPESSSRPLPATLAQSRNLAHALLETAVKRCNTMSASTFVEFVIPIMSVKYRETQQQNLDLITKDSLISAIDWDLVN